MFSLLYPDPENAFILDRLSRLSGDIRLLDLSTREEYQAAIYSAVNSILSLGIGMTPISNILPETPAKIGDLESPFESLNRDAQDIVSQIGRVEDIAGQLFNLSASSQNSIRQQIREKLLSSNHSSFQEFFINNKQLDVVSASIDFGAGLATLPIQSEVPLTPSISIGPNSVGVQVDGPEFLTDDRVDTALSWKGTQLELVLSFSSPQIVNRIRISMDDYQGLDITSMVSSSDGASTYDLLASSGNRVLHMNGVQGKYSGDFIFDFDPQFVLNMRILIEDRVGEESIALRSLELSSRKFGTNGLVSTKAIKVPTGAILFSVDQRVTSPLTSITHQISYNGVTFTSIQPGTLVLSQAPYWYRAVLERASNSFSSPALASSSDPIQDPAYSLSSSTSVPLGGNIVERSLSFSSVSGPIKLRDSILPGTLQIQSGSILLIDGVDYSSSNGIIAFNIPQGPIVVSYQSSALDASLSQLRDYYTPLLYTVRFSS